MMLSPQGHVKVEYTHVEFVSLHLVGTLLQQFLKKTLPYSLSLVSLTDSLSVVKCSLGGDP